MPFKTGAVRIAIESGKPIIPLQYLEIIQWKKNVKITFGKPYFQNQKILKKKIKY